MHQAQAGPRGIKEVKAQLGLPVAPGLLERRGVTEAQGSMAPAALRVDRDHKALKAQAEHKAQVAPAEQGAVKALPGQQGLAAPVDHRGVRDL